MSEPKSSDPRVVHTYDDIEEYDNHLPTWWLYTLYAAMIFAVGYWFFYEVLHVGPDQKGEYEQSVLSDRRAAAERARRLGTVTDDALRTFALDPATTSEGRTVFMANCVACHGAQGGGGIGPNLTDDRWINGGAPTAILRTISVGVPARGMLAWAAPLGDARVQSVTAYVISLRNTNVAGGKAPQGDAYTGR